MDEEKVLDRRLDAEYEGEFSDVIAATHRVADIICTASQLTSKEAKDKLLEGVKIVLTECIQAIDTRLSEGTETILEDD